MDTQNIDIELVKKLSREAVLANASIQPQPTPLTQAPGVSPMRPPRKQRRRKYSELALKEAIELSKQVGTNEAARICNVSVHAIKHEAKRLRFTIGRRASYHHPSKYAPQELDAVVKRALAWYEGGMHATPIRICIERAAAEKKVNANSAYSHYCTFRKDFAMGLR